MNHSGFYWLVFGRNLLEASSGQDCRPDLLTLGEPLVCLAARQSRLVHAHELVKSIGGAEANLAIGLSRMGLRTRFLGWVGDDPFGEEVIRTLRGEGVDVADVQRSADRPTGLMVRESASADGVNVYYYRRGSAATGLGVTTIPDDESPPRHIHVTGITLALGSGPSKAVHELLARAVAWGVPVSFDPNFRLKLSTLDEAVSVSKAVLDHVDHLLLSEFEALSITGTSTPEGALESLNGSVAHVVLRRGEHGALAAAEAFERIEVPAVSVGPMVDSVGAGDGFTAGYLYEILTGRDFPTALATGAWSAGHVVAHQGDYEGLPFRADYEAWATDRPTVHR